ncbi:MAG TPA: alpha/beta-hydrolase family protein [Euzebya sp.]|nr:alpha/beta-hydrolase family protein [Euzebya sp.]
MSTLHRSAPVRQAVHWLRPDLSLPSTPLATVSWLDSFEPSLMPRTSMLQGIVGGVAVLSSRAVAARTERLLQPALGGRGDVRRRLAVRAVVAAAGVALTSLPERDRERLWWSGLRGGGAMLRTVAVGGAIHDVGYEAWVRQPSSRSGVRAAVAVASVTAGLALWADRQLRLRTAAVEPWPIEQRNELPESAAVSAGVVLAGRLLGEAMGLSRRGLRRWLGPGVAKDALATTINGGLWALAASGAYNLGIGRFGASNQIIEPGYERTPDDPRVSGSPTSGAAFAELGRQGRRFITDALDREEIAHVMGEPAIAAPIRVYVGFDSAPLYPTGRAELALEELERTGAYDRSHLLLVSPTGTGWIDQTMVESAELFTRGDLATCAIQYGKYPSFLAVQTVALGRMQFRILLLGVRERLRGMPPERRPRVLVFGESLGAWTASDVIMHQGISGFDHYGIDRALWVGMPWLAKWSRSGMIRGSSDLVPPGTVSVFDRTEQLMALSDADRNRLRAVILSHDNDPIALLGPDLLVQRPSWLRSGQRGRGVPPDMRWIPIVTFLQTFVDAINSMVQVPGEFTSYGHDYRADMARVVQATYLLPPTSDAQMAAVQATLIRRDLDRARRLLGSGSCEHHREGSTSPGRGG